MSAKKGKAKARPRGASINTLDAVIRELRMARATAQSLERSATHEFIEIDIAADGAAAIVDHIDRALDLLDRAGGAP